MSRCFPYPPPGYAGKCASNEALIWTIKLQRESEKPKSEKKKDRKKEKKEKKREDKTNGTISLSEKKEKRIEDKSNGNIIGKKTFTDEKLHRGGKQQESSNEHMEKSTLTEERGRPCSSSDSTENSGKRKRQSPPAANNEPRNPGTVIRLVLNSRKKDDRPTSSINAAPSSSSLSQKANVAAAVNSSAMNLHIIPPKSNISMASVYRKADAAVVKSSDPKVHIAPPKSDATQLIISSSNKDKEALCPVPKGTEQKTYILKEVKLPRQLRKYKALFERWVPSPMEIETVSDDDDEDWLFGSKKEGNSDKRMKCCKEEVSSYGKPAAYQPRAQFLSDADIYALPFTVPF